MLEARIISETLVRINQIAWRHISRPIILHRYIYWLAVYMRFYNDLIPYIII
jgi:hypothetical protein